MNKLLKKRILIISMSLAILLLINIGISYSYYLGKVVGNETSATISFKSAGIVIEYENNSGNITDSNIIPGWSTTKSFAVKSTLKENTSDNSEVKMGYIVKMYVDSNDFPDNSIVYSLSQNGVVGSGQAMDNVSNVGIPTGTNMDGIVIGAGYFAVGDNEHNYTLTINYANTDEVDGNSSFAVHLGAAVAKLATVTIDLDGGTFTGATTRFAQLGGVINLEEPSKDGYTFIGWEITVGDGSVVENQILANSSKVTVKAKFKPNIPDPVNFATDSWETIAANVQTNKEATSSVYKVGDTKEIAIDGFTNRETGSNGLYTIRIANNSHYDSDCKDDSGNILDSKTACGFVIEFVDIIEKRRLNSGGGDVGGWPATELRTYLNADLLAKLPSDLQSVIIDTTVISGYGRDKNTNRIDGNWEAIDKIYLLSAKEVWVDGSSDDISRRDTAYNNTRQLDYFEEKGVTYNNYADAKKYFDGSTEYWWLRTATNSLYEYFARVLSNGNYGNDYGYISYGIAPAFRSS